MERQTRSVPSSGHRYLRWPTESPFVVFKDNKFYLFVCTNTPYSNTAVYESADPYHWDIKDRVGDIGAHAAEVITLQDGTTFISRAGCAEGGLYVARLDWK